MRIIFHPKRLSKEDIKIEAISSIQTIRRSATASTSCGAALQVQEPKTDVFKIMQNEQNRK